METATLVLEIAILIAVILNILKDLFWSKRQKEYYKSITPTKILGDLKSLKELLDSTVEDRDELTETVKELKREIKRLEKEGESRKVETADKLEEHFVQIDFGNLKNIQERFSILNTMNSYQEMDKTIKMLGEQISQIKNVLLTEGS